jgi:Na+-translocating ferredoxin:NAD+ oxidoreductase RnfA subunit
MKEIVLCAIFASFFLNLSLHTGLGMAEIYRDIDSSLRGPLVRCVVLSIVVFLCWLLWTFVLTPLSLGFFDIVFIFPLCALALHTVDEQILKQKCHGELFYEKESALSSLVPLCVFSLLITLRIASSVAEAAILSLSFSSGSVLAALILGAIHLRTRAEPIGAKIAGLPFIFISNGLLAFIFSITATILLRQ